MSPPPRIAIIGAGPSGLTLDALLHKRHIPFIIFELRPRPTEADLATISGMLDLHPESGLAAIKACGLYEDFLPLTAECEQEFRVVDMDGNLRVGGPMGEDRPEISRHNLTRLLLSGVPEDMIQWECKLLSARQEEYGGTVLLEFGGEGEEKDTEEVDLVVGADGAWSRVRKMLLPDAGTPRYTGVQNLIVTATEMSTRFPQLAELVGKGSMFSVGGGHQCAAHRGARDSSRLHLSVKVEEEDFVKVRGLEGKTAAEVGEVYLEDEKLYGKWGEKMKELIRTVCEEDARDHPGQKADIRGIYELAVGHKWQHRPGVTIIGDAAHLMTPWAGEGANVSMWDSLDLAKVIGDAWDVAKAKGGEDSRRVFLGALEPNLAAFEKAMQERGAIHAEDSRKNGEMIFSDGALEKLVAFFSSVLPGAGPPPPE